MDLLRSVLAATADTAFPAFIFAWTLFLVLLPVALGSGWSFIETAEFQRGTVSLAAAIPFVGAGMGVLRSRKRR